MRPISRDCDEHEHTKPTQFYECDVVGVSSRRYPGRQRKSKTPDAAGAAPRSANCIYRAQHRRAVLGRRRAVPVDPQPGLGGAAVMAAGTPEQKERFLKRFKRRQAEVGRDGDYRARLRFGFLAVTTTATRDGDHWVINGTKIFCTAGEMAAQKSDGFVVVWATVDKSAGRPGIKPFVVEHNTPGMTVARVENKLGIRASRYRRAHLRQLPRSRRRSARQRRSAQGRRLQGRDGDLRCDPADRRGDGDRSRARGARFRARLSQRAEGARSATVSRRGV